VGITAGSREVPGRNACDRRHTYRIIIIIIIITMHETTNIKFASGDNSGSYNLGWLLGFGEICSPLVQTIW